MCYRIREIFSMPNASLLAIPIFLSRMSYASFQWLKEKLFKPRNFFLLWKHAHPYFFYCKGKIGWKVCKQKKKKKFRRKQQRHTKIGYHVFPRKVQKKLICHSFKWSFFQHSTKKCHHIYTKPVDMRWLGTEKRYDNRWKITVKWENCVKSENIISFFFVLDFGVIWNSKGECELIVVHTLWYLKAIPTTSFRPLIWLNVEKNELKSLCD